MKEIELDFNLNELIDIRETKIKVNLSDIERMSDFEKQIKNPYCYKHRDYRIIVEFGKEHKTRLKQIFKENANLKNNDNRKNKNK